MWGWIAGAAALVAIVVAGVNLDFIRKTDTFVASFHQNLAATLQIMQAASSSLTLISPAFENGASIPAQYTCDAGNLPSNPPVTVYGVPSEAKSLVLIMDDPDVPKAIKQDGVFDHWVVFNIPPTTTLIGEGAAVGDAGLNGSGKAAYTGPCPPKEYEPSEHRYVFTLYALDMDNIKFEQTPTKAEVLEAIKGHIIAQVQLVGKYKRR